MCQQIRFGLDQRSISMACNNRLAIDKTKAGSSQQCAGLNLLQKGCVVSLVFILNGSCLQNYCFRVQL